MANKTSINLPEYPCTRCDHKTDLCLSEPQRCAAWVAWNDALSQVGAQAVEAIKATGDRDALHDLQEREYAAWLRLQDEKGSKVSTSLTLAAQLMQIRAEECRQSCSPEASVYAICLHVLCIALDGDYECIQAFVGSSRVPAPPQPGESWVDWYARLMTGE